jgi:ferredoxin
MKVIVDPDRCEGNVRCVAAAPEVFELGDDDIARVKIVEPSEDLRTKVERAARLCPRQAITIVED